MSAASAATGPSDVPAETMATVPDGSGIGPSVTARATRSTVALASSRAMTSMASSLRRVAMTARSGCLPCKVFKMPTIWAGDLPAPYTTSGSPVRAARSTSTRAKPRSAVRGSSVTSSVTGPNLPPGQRVFTDDRLRLSALGCVTLAPWNARVEISTDKGALMAKFESYLQGTPNWIEHMGA